MAEALFNRYSRENNAESAGAKPDYYIKNHGATIPKKDQVLRCMRDIGIDLSKRRVKKVTRKMVKSADIIVAIMEKRGAGKDLPAYVKENETFRLWQIKDVNGRVNKGLAYAQYKRSRDEIKKRVLNLVKEIG